MMQVHLTSKYMHKKLQERISTPTKNDDIGESSFPVPQGQQLNKIHKQTNRRI